MPNVSFRGPVVAKLLASAERIRFFDLRAAYREIEHLDGTRSAATDLPTKIVTRNRCVPATPSACPGWALSDNARHTPPPFSRYENQQQPDMRPTRN